MLYARVPYPVSDVTICGILRNANRVICASSDVFAYRGYLELESALLLMVDEVFTSAVKEIELTGAVTLDADVVDVLTERSTGELEQTVILSALLDTAIRRAVALQAAIELGGDIQPRLLKALESIVTELKLTGTLSELTRRSALGVIDGAVGLDSPPVDTARSVSMGENAVRSALRLVQELELALKKAAVFSEDTLHIEASLQIIARKYRTLGELSGIKLGDLSSWTLRQFYYIEE